MNYYSDSARFVETNIVPHRIFDVQKTCVGSLYVIDEQSSFFQSLLERVNIFRR